MDKRACECRGGGDSSESVDDFRREVDLSDSGVCEAGYSILLISINPSLSISDS